MTSSRQKSASKLKEKDVLLRVSQVSKRYGRTLALDQCNIYLRSGEILGLVGGNGAGKSTLSRIISGVTRADGGEIQFAGQNIDRTSYHSRKASELGVKVVYQELSLCTNLTVYENFYVVLSDFFRGKIQWRSEARSLAKKAISEIFPDSGIDVTWRLDKLTIAQQQMVEIARAFADPRLKLLILDEPTSSLAEEQTNQLLGYIKKRKEDGIACIYISHRLKEIIRLVDRIDVIQNGKNIWCGPVSETSEEDLVDKMAGALEEAKRDAAANQKSYKHVVQTENQNVRLTANSLTMSKELQNVSFSAHGGEIIGLAGLEGNGQKELLHRLFSGGRSTSESLEIVGSVAYVTGDRKKEGVFPLWSILQNLMITRLSFGRLVHILHFRSLLHDTQKWYDTLQIKSDSVAAPITDLSGGNQQKVLVARAMVSDADIILLDDPTRGVDVATKRQIYELLIDAANMGKLIVLYSSDNLELELCNRVEVMRYGTIVKELQGDAVTQDNIIEASFLGEELKPTTEQDTKKAESTVKTLLGKTIRSAAFVPFVAMLLIYLACGLQSKAVFTAFGTELLLSGAAPLIILSLAQMYIIGLGHVDLGAGYFMGLINVLCATILNSNPALGTLSLVGAVLAYACMGLVVAYRNIPAVVMTLGAQFIWYGIALTIQESPGGQVPTYITNIFWMDSDIPVVLVVILTFAVAAYLFYRSKYGTVLKGFGNNSHAMVCSGWSLPKAYFAVYLTAGLIAFFAGVVLSGINGASDCTATGSYTMQTIAAVIVGGGYLLGGLVSVPGAIFGAVTFSLISSLLGFMKVSTELTAAVQGLILILILALRIVRRGGKKHE